MWNPVGCSREGWKQRKGVSHGDSKGAVQDGRKTTGRRQSRDSVISITAALQQGDSQTGMSTSVPWRAWAPTPRVADSAGLGWSPNVCLSNKFPGDADVAG